jgi:hypothetical protein
MTSYQVRRPELLGAMPANVQTVIYASAGVAAGLLAFYFIRRWRKRKVR